MVTVERTGPALRAALAVYAPEDAARFAAASYGTRWPRARTGPGPWPGPRPVLRRWHTRAVMAANPLTADERAQVERAKGADFTGFRSGTTMASLGRRP
jgi:hypothetical protein